MSRSGGHAQKAVFVHKSGKPKTQLRDAHIHDRLVAAQPSDLFASQRLSRFLEAREIVDKTFHSLNERYFAETMRDLSEFVYSAGTDGRLPTVFLLKANIKAYISKIKAAEPDWHTISIHSKECPNLKSTIKLIVNRFTESDSHLVSDRRLTYDFHVLIDWLRATSGSNAAAQRLVVVVEDTDGFDPEIVRNLISHMHSYVANHELSLCLLLNLSVPLSLVEENLSQENVVGMNARVFRGLPPATTFIEECSAALYEPLRLVLSTLLVEKLHALDILQAFKHLHYAVLGHFAGNPLASANTTPQVLQMKDIVFRLPSVVDNLAQDPGFAGKIESTPFEELAFLIPELQVGGRVLDIAFDPNYRPLLEQALTDPRLYTKSLDGADRMSVPITILYQLTRESSIYINIYDFFCAFKEMIKLDPTCPDRDRQSMAIFLETITSLKIMGILRDCKRKFECVEKVSWKGV